MPVLTALTEPVIAEKSASDDWLSTQVRTLGTFEEHELKGIANELGMNFGHGHKFADACKQVRNRTHAPSIRIGRRRRRFITTKNERHRAAGAGARPGHRGRDAGPAPHRRGRAPHRRDDDEDLDECGTDQGQLDEVVAKTRGQTRLLADLCSGTTECPKLVWMARADPKGLASWISPSAWYGKRVKIQFVCPVSMKVGPGPGFELVLSKDWMKKYGVALNVSLGILRLAMQVGAAAMGCHHCHIADMSVDRAIKKCGTTSTPR